MGLAGVLKIAGAVVAGIIVLAFAAALFSATFGGLSHSIGMPSMPAGITAPGYGGMGGDTAGYDTSSSYDGVYGEKAGDSMMAQLSSRNAMPGIPPQSPAGPDAEAFEVTQYSASIESGDVEDTCGTVAGLKSRTDVIFENSNTYDRGCSFTFKVEKAKVAEILAFIEKLDPKDLSDNTYTIKRQVDDYTSEVEVLQNKRASIEATLKSAISAYDGITALATRTENAEALARIIDSRIGIIERLTQEKININTQLDRLSRAKSDALDRLDYTYFSVSVFENRFIDMEQLKDSWKQSIKDFVFRFNAALQGLTVGIVLLLVMIIQWALYALIVLVVVKYGWKVGKSIWYR